MAAKDIYNGNTTVFNVSSSTTARATVKASGYYNITLTTLCKDSTTTSERHYTIKFEKTSDASVSGYWIVGSMTSNGTWGSTKTPIFVATSVSSTGKSVIVKVADSSAYGDSGWGCAECKAIYATYAFSSNSLTDLDWDVHHCNDGNTGNWGINVNGATGTFKLTVMSYDGTKTNGSHYTCKISAQARA